jgi:anti-sigma regulatory factor (Ser/Thr protein kinase)
MSQATASDLGEAEEAPDGTLSAKLPADPISARQARSAVRRALEAWGMADLSGDAELLASELVANAVEHAGGKAIGFALRCQADGAGQRAVVCEVSDNSNVLPKARDAGPEAERGHGLMIVAALASASGVRTSPGGKTAWFTLALSRRARRAACLAMPSAEPRPR